MDNIIMSGKEREQAKLFEQLKLGLINQKETAVRLGITDRWVREKIKRYLMFGDHGLTHKSRGKSSANKWNKEHAQLLINLLLNEWEGFGPTFATEKLKEVYGIRVSVEVVRQVMIKAGLWHAKVRKAKHRKRRDRKSMFGMMIQLDGSSHDWFEGRAGKCTLLVFIDDATSQILWLEFVKSESVIDVMKATKNYVQKYGKPQIFYTDFGSVFHVNLNNQENIKKTQWENSCIELGIEVKHAHSPQAKGRVERCNKTLQDRLIKELRLAKISSIEDANNFLRTSNFIEKHNLKYAIAAAQEGDAHANCAEFNLEDIFSIKEKRILANDYTIVYNKRIFQLGLQQKTIIRPKNEIIVKEHLNGIIKLWLRKTELYFIELNNKPQRIQEVKTYNNYKPQKPCENSRRWASGQSSLINKERIMKSAMPAAEAIKNEELFT